MTAQLVSLYVRATDHQEWHLARRWLELPAAGAYTWASEVPAPGVETLLQREDVDAADVGAGEAAPAPAAVGDGTLPIIECNGCAKPYGVRLLEGAGDGGADIYAFFPVCQCEGRSPRPRLRGGTGARASFAPASSPESRSN